MKLLAFKSSRNCKAESCGDGPIINFICINKYLIVFVLLDMDRQIGTDFQSEKRFVGNYFAHHNGQEVSIPPAVSYITIVHVF